MAGTHTYKGLECAMGGQEGSKEATLPLDHRLLLIVGAALVLWLPSTSRESRMDWSRAWLALKRVAKARPSLRRCCTDEVGGRAEVPRSFGQKGG